MFGLTKREQRWKAELEVIKVVVPAMVALAVAVAKIATEEQSLPAPPKDKTP
jgi:hypothetical protein